jgi:hypothetical protein
LVYPLTLKLKVTYSSETSLTFNWLHVYIQEDSVLQSLVGSLFYLKISNGWYYKITVFLDVTPNNMVVEYRCFRRICLYLQTTIVYQYIRCQYRNLDVLLRQNLRSQQWT